jgi:hypothetical protein
MTSSNLSILAEVSLEVSVHITKGPSCAVWFLEESTLLPTHSQPDRSIESPLYPLHLLVCQTSLYHILRQTVSISAHSCTIFMGGCSMNWSLDLGMISNHMLSESTRQSPELSESTEHSFCRGYVPRVHDQDDSVVPCGGPNRSILQQDGGNTTPRDRVLL